MERMIPLSQFFLILALPALVAAQTELSVRGAYQTTDEHPFTFSEIKQREYQDTLTGQEASYVLGETPSVTFYSDSGAYQGYSYIRLRGIDQTRINVTLDGVPLNEPEDQGIYFSNFPDFLSSTESIQVIRGVGTTQNGTTSYGGSVLLFSPQITSSSREVGVSGGSFGSQRTYVEYQEMLPRGGGMYLRANQLRSDGYRRRSGNEAQSAVYKWNNGDAADRWILSGFLGHQENELSYIGSTREEIARDRRHNGNSEEDDNFLQSLTYVQNKRTLRPGGILTSTVYYNHLQGNYDFDLNNFLGLPRTRELFNYALSSHLLGAFSNYRESFGQSTIVVGVHGNRYVRYHEGSERSLGELYENHGEKGDESAFVKAEHTVGDVLLLGDLQYRHTSFAYDGSVPLHPLGWTFWNPKGGFTHLITGHTNWYYSVGRTGREPTRNDIFLGNDDLQATAAGDPLLGVTQSESVVDHELGLRTQGDSWRISSNLFYLDFSDEIVLNGKLGPTGLPLTDSVERSYRYGIETDLQWSLSPRTRCRSSAALIRSEIEQADLSVTPVMSPRVVLDQSIEYLWQSARVRGDLRYQSSSYVDFANSESLGSSLTMDVSGHFEVEPVEIGVHLRNLFDEKAFGNGYVDSSGAARYFVQPPRNLMVTATWRF